MSTSIGLNLGGSAYVPTSAATFAPQPVPRNPALAFFLSLLLPGLGQFYCRKNSRGAWTLVFFLLSSLATLALTPTLVAGSASPNAFIWGILLRVALFLYVFAFLDAYFTAREMSAGTDPFIAESPRIAAILNLLTRGFGYFYLGQRAAGFAVFIGLGLFQQVILQTITAGNPAAGPIFMELLLAAMGVHAYQIARKRENEILATIQPAPQFSAIGGLAPAVPVSLAILLAVAYLALCSIGFFLPDYSAINQTPARVSKDAQGTNYSNPEYGIEFKTPAAWSLDYKNPKHIVTAQRNDSACAADLRIAAWSPLLPVTSYVRALSAALELPEHKGARLLRDVPASLAGLSARSIVLSLDQGGGHITENQIVARNGMTLYVLSLDSITELSGDCQSDFQFMQQHLTLPR